MTRDVKCWARLWDIFHQVWPLPTYLCLWITAFYADTPWPWPMNRRPTPGVMWAKFILNLIEIEQYPAEVLKTWRVFAHVMSRCDLVLWPVNLEPRLSRVWTIYKSWAKLINPPLSYWRFSTFSNALLGMGRDWQTVLMVAWTQLH